LETTKIFSKVSMVFLIFSLLLSTGCTIMKGTASLTMLSREINANSPNVEVIGEMDKESDTITWCLIFLLFGNAGLSHGPSHEAPVARLLEKYNADMLVDAEMTSSAYGIPYLYMRFSSTVKGRPARFVQGGEK
jgi:hypothetical protein